jgi:hypothetical protein
LAFFLCAHLEAAESTKINCLAIRQSISNESERGIDYMLYLCFAALRPGGDLIDESVPVHKPRR